MMAKVARVLLDRREAILAGACAALSRAHLPGYERAGAEDALGCAYVSHAARAPTRSLDLSVLFTGPGEGEIQHHDGKGDGSP